MADWSSEKTLDFIEEYRKCTELWRSSDKNYKNQEERRSAIQELGEKYSLDSKSILNKNPNHTSLNENYVVPCKCLRAI